MVGGFSTAEGHLDFDPIIVLVNAVAVLGAVAVIAAGVALELPT